jgi:uridine kinase
MVDDTPEAMAAVIRRVHALRQRQPRVAVAVDGPDAAGKTRFAAALASQLGSGVVQASVDDFQRSREERGRRGTLSAEGYYEDAFDHVALRQHLLTPFRGGADMVAISRWDYRRDVADERWASELSSA